MCCVYWLSLKIFKLRTSTQRDIFIDSFSWIVYYFRCIKMVASVLIVVEHISHWKLVGLFWCYCLAVDSFQSQAAEENIIKGTLALHSVHNSIVYFKKLKTSLIILLLLHANVLLVRLFGTLIIPYSCYLLMTVIKGTFKYLDCCALYLPYHYHFHITHTYM